MDLKIAATLTLRQFPTDCKSERDVEGRTLEHARWMLECIASGDVQGNKAQRWLGYAQAVGVLKDVTDLPELRRTNNMAS